ncbi:MAG TPA: hypothetical protein PKK63_03440 [Bacillota bacterium]|nr:hypothetical protein [Bacillota bacterium]
MKYRIVFAIVVLLLLSSHSSALASNYVALGASYRAFSPDPLWTAQGWQENLKGTLSLCIGTVPGMRAGMVSYLGYSGGEPVLSGSAASGSAVSISARAGFGYDLVKYEKDGLYVGFGPAVGISYGNTSSSKTEGTADFGIGAQAICSILSGKVEIEGNALYTFKDVFVDASFFVRYNPVGPLVLFTGLDYLRRDIFVSAGAGIKF